MIYNDDGTLKYDMTEKKILLIDVADTGWSFKHTFANKEDLRQYLINLHSDDMTNEKDEETLKKLPLGDICEMFNWDYYADNQGYGLNFGKRNFKVYTA